MATHSDPPKTRMFEGLLRSVSKGSRALHWPTLSRRPHDDDLANLGESLLSERGESSGVALARQILDRYAQLEPGERLAFLRILASRFGADPKRLERALAAYQAKPDAETAHDLHEAAEPRRQEFLRRLNLAPGGTQGLVRMREDVLRHLREHPELRAVDGDFVHLFHSWFNRGFLVLRKMDWNTPAAILEKVIRYEAVHEIKSWEELRRRLDPPDRRCFGFFHPALPGEPLIFVEVALARDAPRAIAPLLAPDRAPIAPEDARTAVFYSISNCQEGLRGISFGNFLIKQVAEDLRRDLPHLKTFVTLSPVPGFRQWLARARSTQAAAVSAALSATDDQRNVSALDPLREELEGCVSDYLLDAKNKSGRPLDPVARFHLGNGAQLERVNWLGDTSSKGLREAAGFMVNYLYDLRRVEANHEAFFNKGEVVASKSVHALQRRHGRATDRESA